MFYNNFGAKSFFKHFTIDFVIPFWLPSNKIINIW